MLIIVQEADNIEKLKDCIVKAISPLEVYLFGSFAQGNSNENSDYDFCVIVHDEEADIMALTQKAYKSMRGLKNRPVDIVIVKKSRFEERKNWQFSLEREVASKGVLLYAA